MERNVDAFEWDGGEAALQLDWFWLSFGLLNTFANDLDEMCLDIFERHGLRQGLDVDVLGFEIVCDIREGIKSPKLGSRLASECLKKGKSE